MNSLSLSKDGLHDEIQFRLGLLKSVLIFNATDQCFML